MTGLPRRPIDPLPARSGGFDEVLRASRRRRQRRLTTVTTVTAVFFVGIAGGVSLDSGVTGVRDTIAIAFPDVVGEAPTAEATQPRTSAVVTPEVDARKTDRTGRSGRTKKGFRSGAGGAARPARPAAATAAAPATIPRVAKVVGRALSSSGTPIAGLYVYPGRPGVDRFLPTRDPATRTARDGTFSLACPGSPVLLSPWPLNAAAGRAASRARWEARFVGGGLDAAGASDATCSTDGSVTTTTVLQGSSVTGTVEMPAACSDAAMPLWLWVHGNRDLTVRLADLSDGDSYTIRGLPPGQHTIAANGNRSSVTVGGGATSTQDVTFSCVSGVPPETIKPEPSTGPTPLPTPTETVTSVPTETPSDAGAGAASSTTTAPATTPATTPSLKPEPKT